MCVAAAVQAELTDSIRAHGTWHRLILKIGVALGPTRAALPVADRRAS